MMVLYGGLYERRKLMIKTMLWDHQKAIVSYMRDHSYGLIAASPRTGKTLSTFAYIDETGYRTLILTTKKGLQVWQNEFNEFVRQQTIVVLGEKSSSANAKKLSNNPDARIVVVNYESFWRGAILSLLIHRGFDAIIADEGHYLKSNNSKVSKHAYILGKGIPHRFILTGTPLPNSPMDLFGQARFLDDKLFMFDGVKYLKAFYKFRARYANLYSVAPNVFAIASYKNLAELNQVMASFTYRVDSTEVFDLPEAMHTKQYVTLSEKAMDTYNSFADELILDIDKSIITADNVLVKATKLQQIAGGFVFDDEHDIKHVHDDKIQAVKNILADIKEPVVIFARYSAEVYNLWVHLTQDYSVGILDGKHNELANWQNGEKDILIVQIDTGSEAISLVRAAHVIYYSVTYSLGKFEQSMMRVSGPKQKASKLFYYYIIAAHTIDEDIYDALQSKTDVKNKVMKSLLAYRRTR
jgi:SNF2 family DNA or RNA helicase